MNCSKWWWVAATVMAETKPNRAPLLLLLLLLCVFVVEVVVGLLSWSFGMSSRHHGVVVVSEFWYHSTDFERLFSTLGNSSPANKNSAFRWSFLVSCELRAYCFVIPMSPGWSWMYWRIRSGLILKIDTTVVKFVIRIYATYTIY
jgi:hypothetical protein